MSEITGLNLSTACQFYKAYEKGGRNATKIKKRGRPTGSCKTLTPEQEYRLKKAITDKTPHQLKFLFYTLDPQGSPAADHADFFDKHAHSHRR